MSKILLLLQALIVFHQSHGRLEPEILERTLPVYGLANAASKILDDGSSCRRRLQTFRRAVDDRILWALKMLDSSGEPKPGFVYGNNYWLGSRSQCFDTENRDPFVLKRQIMSNNSRYHGSEEFPPFAVNYFVAYFTHNSTLQYHVRLPNEDLVSLGLCLPAACTTGELSLILKAMFQDRRLIVGELYSADFQLVRVRDLKDDHQWLLDWRFILIKIIFMMIIILMGLGTIYDLRTSKKRFEFVKMKELDVCENNNEAMKLSDNVEAGGVVIDKWKPGIAGKILLCFSVYSNTQMILSTKLSNDSVAAIHGLRFLGMVWIVMIHTVFYMSDYADNKPWSWRLADGFAVQVISNSTLSVDTFFFLSGFLVAYIYLNAERDHDRNKKRSRIIQFLVALVRRFIRLTPVYMLMVGILQINASWYGITSQFHMTERPHEVCEKYWWRNILYINNLFDRETMCMSWSWYLSNDMQFFIVGMLLLIISSTYFYLAVALLLLLLLGSIVVTGYISYVNDYIPTMDQQFHMLDKLYDPPWTRIGPYLIGMVTAVIIIRLKGELPLRKRTLVLCWLLGISCNLVVLFGLFERQIDVLLSAVYVSFSRTVWAFGLAWLLVACCTKHAGIVNTILSFKAWIPLSRLTYCAYLLNPFLINSIYLHSESAVHVDFVPNVTVFLGSLTMTYICSYALSLMLETPLILLMRTFCDVNVQRR